MTIRKGRTKTERPRSDELFNILMLVKAAMTTTDDRYRSAYLREVEGSLVDLIEGGDQ